MTKEETIKYLQQLYPNGGHCWLDEQRIEAINMAIDALKEEPVSEDLEKIVEEIAEPTILNAYGTKELARRLRNTICGTFVSEGLKEASKEWLSPQLDKSYAAYGETKQMELTHFDGYAMLDAIEFGAQWQKEQMMKDAVNGLVYAKISNGDIMIRSHYFKSETLNYLDNVKLIPIKED